MKYFHVFAVALIAAAPVTAAASGLSVYQSSCIACHKIGVAGAPKLGDKSAWKPRIDQGLDVLVEHAVLGFKGPDGRIGMPPKGGKASLSDDEVRAAVEYMVSQSKSP